MDTNGSVIIRETTTVTVAIEPIIFKLVGTSFFSGGNWDKLPARYEEILAYAKQNHLQLCGYAYEIGFNEMVIDRIKDYITKLQSRF